MQRKKEQSYGSRAFVTAGLTCHEVFTSTESIFKFDNLRQKDAMLII